MLDQGGSHAFDPNNLEAEAGETLWVPGQPSLSPTTKSLNSTVQNNILNNKNKGCLLPSLMAWVNPRDGRRPPHKCRGI